MTQIYILKTEITKIQENCIYCLGHNPQEKSSPGGYATSLLWQNHFLVPYFQEIVEKRIQMKICQSINYLQDVWVFFTLSVIKAGYLVFAIKFRHRNGETLPFVSIMCF